MSRIGQGKQNGHVVVEAKGVAAAPATALKYLHGKVDFWKNEEDELVQRKKPRGSPLWEEGEHLEYPPVFRDSKGSSSVS